MNPNEIVLAVLDALERTSTPYMLVGSFSSNLYGIPRSTKDADLVVQLSQSQLQDMTAALSTDFLSNPR